MINEKDMKVYNSIVEYMIDHNYPPTMKEIAEDTGIKSKSTVYEKLRKLKDAGIINYIENQPRTITVPGYVIKKITVNGEKYKDS